jgi:dienelactone hydrolase
MSVALHELLEVRSTFAFDLDDAGHILVGNDDTGTVQLYEIGPGLRWTQLTGLGEGCSGRYLPGERAVVVHHDAGGNERGQLSLLRLDTDEHVLTPLVRDERYLHTLLDVLPGHVVYATNRRNGVDFDVVLRDVHGGEERVLYDRGGYVNHAALSKDARYLLVVRPGGPANSDQLVLVDAATGEVEELTPYDEPAVNRHVAWMPDSSAFAFTSNMGREFTGLARYDLPARSWEYLVTDDHNDVVGIPAPDGRRVVVGVNRDGVDEVGTHDMYSGYEVLRRSPRGGGTLFFPAPVWSPDAQRCAFTHTSPRSPYNVRIWSGGNVAQAITHGGDELDRHALVDPETYRVPTPDGEQVPCFLYRDADCDGSVVLVIHGGPAAQAVQSWNPIVQALVAQGHAVAVPNVRGSTGYGKRWYSLDDGRGRLSAVADLAAIHAWLPSVGLDQRRAALYGRSYGGYLALAGLVFQPELWAAGVDVVGISSLVTFLENTAAYRRAHREREYGSLERDREFLVHASPLTHVDDIRAPLLILHGANDPRVPLSEAEQLAAAVRARGGECDLVVYPDEGHMMNRRQTVLDSHTRATRFLRHHLSRARVGG